MIFALKLEWKIFSLKHSSLKWMLCIKWKKWKLPQHAPLLRLALN